MSKKIWNPTRHVTTAILKRSVPSKLPIFIALLCSIALSSNVLHASAETPSDVPAANSQAIAPSPTYSVLYDFQGQPRDGSSPRGALLRDSAGNLYGTASSGGQFQRGAVYRLTSKGTETIFSFRGAPHDGEAPMGALIQDSEGNFYGTTSEGGLQNAGTIYRIDKNGHEQILHTFNVNDGLSPFAGLVMDAAGNLYGTTLYGGNLNCGNQGCGEVFELDKSGNLTVLYAFNGGADGAFPYAELTLDAAGNLYSTTQYGGNGVAYSGDGVVFKVSPSGVETVLHTFAGGSDGSNPNGGVVFDQSGNLYGTTLYGGGNNGCGGLGCGTVFRLDHTSGQESILRTFVDDANGAMPSVTPLLDGRGNLYATTLYGGDLSLKCFETKGCGVVFQLNSAGEETVLQTFTLFENGGFPNVSLIRDEQGNLYGTAYLDGSADCSCGLVYRVTP